MAKCVRVYNDGSMKEEIRPDSCLSRGRTVRGWLIHNKTFRFGTALFVDGRCHQVGYLGEERCKEISKKLKGEL